MVWSVDPVRIAQARTAKMAHVGMWSVDPTPGVVRWPVLDTYAQELRADMDWSGVSLYAPAAGQIDSVETEWAGDKLNIALAAAPEILVTIFHFRREPGLEAGSPVLAGQKLGQHIGPQSMSDIAVHDRSRDYLPLSYLELLDGRLLDAYRARGVKSPAAAIISRARRARSAATAHRGRRSGRRREQADGRGR